MRLGVRGSAKAEASSRSSVRFAKEFGDCEGVGDGLGAGVVCAEAPTAQKTAAAANVKAKTQTVARGRMSIREAVPTY